MVDFIVNNWVPIVSGIFIPALVGLATRPTARPLVKAALTFLASALTGAVEAVTVGDVPASDLGGILAYVLAVWTTAHLSYKMAWKPAGNGVNLVTKATPDSGLS